MAFDVTLGDGYGIYVTLDDGVAFMLLWVMSMAFALTLDDGCDILEHFSVGEWWWYSDRATPFC